jgi:indole-3-acetate monooxygenase
MIGGCYGAFGGYLPAEAAREIYGSDPRVVSGGAFRPFGEAVVVDGGYRVSGQWPLGSGCHHCSWMVGGCRILDGDKPRLRADGTQVTRLLFFPARDCKIIDTWHSPGLRGTGSHDYAVADLFVPAEHSLSFREKPVEQGPLYALPTIGLFATAIAAVPLGIARHAIDIFTELARAKVASRSRQTLNQHAMLQADLGRAEALVRSGRAFLYETLGAAWKVVSTGDKLDVAQRAMLWLAATQATSAATQAVDLMFSAGGSASVYANTGLERCLRDIRTAGQHVVVVPSNYEMVGQALLDFDMRSTLLLAMDDRGTG